MLLKVIGTFLCLTAAVFGQVETSTSIRGIVNDASGAPIPGAKVMVTNVATGEERSGTTDASGFYAFPSLVPSTYNVTVSHTGFKRTDVHGRVLQSSQSAQVDVILQVGDTAESVTVSAAGAELVTTTSAEVGGTIVPKLVENLPMSGRNFFDLTALLPQVAPQTVGTQLSVGSARGNTVLGSGAQSPLQRLSGFWPAGNREGSTNISIDGVNVQSSAYSQTTPQSPPSSIQEVKIHVSGMNAEFGNGAAAVTIVTKGGSNQLHGEMYDYFRNSDTDANTFFNNLTGAAKSPFHFNQFGAALGGPVIKNKVFFFGAYEGLRVRRSNFQLAAMPPAELRTGDFSNYHPPGAGGTFLPVPVIYNPLSFNPANGLRTPFPGNKIPISAMDPVTLKFLNDWVQPNNTVVDGIPNLAGDARQFIGGDQGIARVDWSMDTNNRIYGRFSKVLSPSHNEPPLTLRGATEDLSDAGFSVRYTRVFSPNTVNDFTMGFAKPIWWGGDRDAPNVSALIGLKNVPNGPQHGGPNFAGTGFVMNDPQGSIVRAVDDVYQLGDDITHIRGRHSLKFGFYGMERRLYYDRSGNTGNFTFNLAFTAACPAGNAACTAAQGASGLNSGGHAFASYLLGLPISELFTVNAALYHAGRRYYGFYAQDSWRVNNRLTLNYGLRYEYFSPWFNPRHTISTFNEATGDIQYVLKNPLDYLDPAKGFGRTAELNPNVPETAYRIGKKNFAPRIGLAYSIGPSTVFRAGYGIYFDANTNMNQFSDISGSIAPFALRYEPALATNIQVPTLHVNGEFPFPGPTTIPAPNTNPRSTFRTLSSYYPVGTIQEWSASIQRRISSDWGAEISYQGTHAVHLQQFVDLNAAQLPVGNLASLSLDARRKFPQWGIIGSWIPIGYGRYNGLGATLKNNSWHGLTMMSSFTFAKNLVGGIIGDSDQGNVSKDVAYMWRGPATLTPKFRYVNAFSYDLPFGSGKLLGGTSNPVGKVLISGWRASAILDLTSGAPVQVKTTDTSGTTYGTMPNRICDANDVPGGRNRFQWFNTACFVQPAFATWGNSNFGVMTQPGINNWNLSLAKSTKINFPKETGRIEFRANFFNAFNHTQWTEATANTVQSGNINAGRILNTRAPRNIQFSLTYLF